MLKGSRFGSTSVALLAVLELLGVLLVASAACWK